MYLMGFENKQTLPAQFSPEVIEADRTLVAKKLQTVRGIAIDEYDANVIATANLFYDAVFDPEEVVARYGVNGSEKFPDRLETLQTSLQTVDKDKIPSKDEFVTGFVRAWTSEDINKKSLYPGALDAVRIMIGHGPMIVWTQGDMYGATGTKKGFDQAPNGSFEQIKKIAGGGIGKVRREIARASLEGAGATDLQRKIQDSLTVAASEDKFSDVVLTRMSAYLEKTGSRNVTIIDDRVKNIEKLAELLQRRGFTTRGIWVRQGRNGNQDVPYDHAAITELSSIESITPDVLPAGSATICDFDDVLSNQSIRTKMQRDAVYSLLVDTCAIAASSALVSNEA